MNVVYKIFRKCGDGADGGGTGVNGSVNSSGLIKNLNSLHVRNADVFLDLGSGDDRVILAALAMGANTSFGFELPQNISYSLLFNAAQSMLQTRSSREPVDWSRGPWTPCDIDELSTFECNSHCIFSFWVGMPLYTQNRILVLCNSCLSVKEFAVFCDRKWQRPQQGNQI